MNSWLQLQTQRLREQGFRVRLKLLIKKAIRLGVRYADGYLSRHPKIRAQALQFINFLGLKKYLKSFMYGQPDLQMTPLSSRATQVLRDLQKAIDVRKIF